MRKIRETLIAGRGSSQLPGALMKPGENLDAVCTAHRPGSPVAKGRGELAAAKRFQRFDRVGSGGGLRRDTN
jgi:hypothetical protein